MNSCPVSPFRAKFHSQFETFHYKVNEKVDERVALAPSRGLGSGRKTKFFRTNPNQPLESISRILTCPLDPQPAHELETDTTQHFLSERTLTRYILTCNISQYKICSGSYPMERSTAFRPWQHRHLTRGSYGMRPMGEIPFVLTSKQ